MLVFWRQRLVFLATPKTASTAIEAALSPRAGIVVRPPKLKHTPVASYRLQLAPFLGDTGDFELVALMREPVDWLGSWYRYRQRMKVGDGRSTLPMGFDEFVSAYCAHPQPEFARVGAQATFLAPPEMKPVDHIFRYDRMEDFLVFITARLGCSVKIPQTNVSAAQDLALSPATEALLRRKYARDFDLYDTLG